MPCSSNTLFDTCIRTIPQSHLCRKHQDTRQLFTALTSHHQTQSSYLRYIVIDTPSPTKPSTFTFKVLSHAFYVPRPTGCKMFYLTLPVPGFPVHACTMQTLRKANRICICGFFETAQTWKDYDWAMVSDSPNYDAHLSISRCPKMA